MLTLLLVCAFFSTQERKYLAWVFNAVSLPGDCHATLAMTKSALHGKTQEFATVGFSAPWNGLVRNIEWTLTDSFNSGTGEFTRKVERLRSTTALSR